MKIYDISQEVFGCAVYPGDPVPTKQTVASIAEGSHYNLTAFSMCAHNGTHLDAPRHFLKDGKDVAEIPLDKCVGKAFVASHSGELTAKGAQDLLSRAKALDSEAAKRILLKGDATVSLGAAEVFADAEIFLIGVESQSVGPIDAPMAVHLVLLGASVVLLEGIRLSAVEDGVYLLSAAPLSLAGSDGAPCRALLMEGI